MHAGKCQLEGTARSHLVQHPSLAGVLPALTRSAVALSSWVLKASRDGNLIVSLDSLLQCYPPNDFIFFSCNIQPKPLTAPCCIVWHTGDGFDFACG